MKNEILEICVYNSGEDDYVVARNCTDSNEAIMLLKGLTELGIESCIRYYCWND